MVGLFAAIAELMAVYINTRYDFIGIIGAVLLWVFVAIVALDIVVLHRRRKSLPLTREESVSK
jgi:membrane protein YdbS with pleckstrin-like domain